MLPVAGLMAQYYGLYGVLVLCFLQQTSKQLK
jgi:hypothetical protein